MSWSNVLSLLNKLNGKYHIWLYLVYFVEFHEKREIH